MSSRSLSRSRWQTLLTSHPDAIAAGVCAVLVLLGWLSLDRGWLGVSLLILTAAYAIGGYQSTREGFSALNQAPITGESMPVEKTVGDEVFAGTINGNGALKIQIHQPPESSLIQRVIRLVEQAQTETPPSQQFI